MSAEKIHQLMKRLLTTALLITALGAAIAQTADYKLNVQNFCELTVVDGVGVDYYCRPDSAGWVVFSCAPETASHIMFSNKAEHLTIQTDADEAPIPGVPRVKVYSAALRKAENSGDSLMRIYVNEPVRDFKVRQIGNGDIEIYGVQAERVDAGIAAGNGRMHIDGKAHKATVRNVGTGRIDASLLSVDEVRCFVFGSGDIHVSPAHRLKIYGAGTGIVYFHLAPDKITNRGLGVKVLPFAGGEMATMR